MNFSVYFIEISFSVYEYKILCLVNNYLYNENILRVIMELLYLRL